MHTVGMLDLRAEYELFRDEIRAAVDAVLESQQFISGPAVGEFERAIGSRLGVNSAIAVSNGTDALVCALMTLGIGAGHEVIVPAFSFFATAGSVIRVGAVPVFVDINPGTFNIDPAKIEAAITPRTRAIMAVHLFGQCADMDAINAIASRHKILVIEDAAQAIGASFRGRPAGTLGDIACFSFYPTKNLGGFGEGGLVTTNDAAIGDVARQLRNHGESSRYIHERVGGNFRLDTMKAAILLVKLRRLDAFTARRQRNAAAYDRFLADGSVRTPVVAEGCMHVYHQYSVLYGDPSMPDANRPGTRDALAAHLREHGISTGIYYPVGLHRQPCFASLPGLPTSLPVTESVCSRVLSLPCHPMLSDREIEYVAGHVVEFARGKQPASVVLDAPRTAAMPSGGRAR